MHVQSCSGSTPQNQCARPLGLPNLGALEIACRRRVCDVELTFQNASVLIETKVDADEDGRWEGTEWQTERIHHKTQSWAHLKPDKYYFFITYGTSEFFTKPYRRGPVHASFQHVGLDRMIDLIRQVSSLSLPGSPLYGPAGAFEQKVTVLNFLPV
jgi:hypothetical protein